MGLLINVKALTLLLLLQIPAISAVSWEEWWTYDGISGPAFWGLINPEWSLCNKGRRQSPVNLEPQRLLFDPNLRILHIDKHRISGTITNTGHSVIFTADNETSSAYGTPQIPVNLTGGPLSYRYRFHEIHVHYGLHDQFGSEHSVEGYTFPAEIQIFGYNSQLYANFSDALYRAQGIVGVAILLQLGDLSNPELRMLTDQLERIRYGGDEAPVRRISVRDLLPDTEHYMTYEGSTTAPACYETVTWIVMNKPIYITKQQLHALRRLMQGGPDHPKAPLGNNFRPPQPLLHRPVRTNIDFRNKQEKGGKICATMYKDVHYKGMQCRAILSSGSFSAVNSGGGGDAKLIAGNTTERRKRNQEQSERESDEHDDNSLIVFEP